MPKTLQLKRFLRRTRVADLKSLSEQVGGRSYRSVHRYLRELGCLTSYSHAGRYYALPSSAEFNADGLWFWDVIGFSKYGTLGVTLEELIKNSSGGHTHQELREKLKVRVHNTLLKLTHAGRVYRELVGKQYVYLSKEDEQQRRQLNFRKLIVEEDVADWLAIEILVEIIRECGAFRLLDPTMVMVSLYGRELEVSTSQIEHVIAKYGVKKTAA